MTFIDDTEFTIGGEPILIDEGGKIASFLGDFSPLDIFNEISPPVSFSDGSTDALGGCGGNVSLAVPNWPQMPKLGLNELYWPTGASRFSLGCFLLSGASVETLFSSKQPFQETVTLRMKMEPDLSVDMYAIWKRITGVGDNSSAVYMVFLVDKRYLWQFQDVGDMEITEATTWAGLFTAIGTALSETITPDAVDSAYLNPDRESFARKYANPAILLDAAASSVGSNVLMGFSGSVLVRKWDDNNPTSTVDEIALGNWSLISGGMNEPPIAPANINVIAQGFSGGVVYPNDSYEYIKTTGATGGGIGPWDQVIRTTAYADYDGTIPSTPDNDTILDALAAKIAEDKVKRYTYSYDITFAGLTDVFIDPRHDFALFSIGTPSQFGTKVTTRVKSLPYNSGPSTQLSQDPDLTVIECSNILVPFVLTSNISAQEATADLTDLDFVALSPQQSVTVHDHGDIFIGGISGSNGWAVIKEGDYHIIQLECA